ncbi:MAG: hypothetical protein COA90_01470 [Gammaproteobacteria bacterium]|nr:MAG: hypothetical protein COA90_01470 [Gammaproteobacteria bacterium]
MSVVYRIESGCLGPKGDTHVVDFCKFAQSEFKSLDSDFIAWNIEPRDDKTLPEMQYTLKGKKITQSQAKKYLSLFDKSIEKFEDKLDDKLEVLIEKYMADRD